MCVCVVPLSLLLWSMLVVVLMVFVAWVRDSHRQCNGMVPMKDRVWVFG